MALRCGPKRMSVTGIKRRQANDDAMQLQLERVFGVTLSSNCGLCFDSTNSIVAYPAGCTIVLCNVLRREQHFIVNPSKKVITCLDMSNDGKFLASGEFGHNPAVRIWELSTRTQLAEFGGHKFAIACVRFSRAADQRFVVSIGNQYDQSVSVWNWRTHKQAASNRNTAKIHAVAFAPNDHFFVTVGVRHVRFWSIQAGAASTSQTTVPLSGRNAILGDVQNNVFIDVACACVGDSRAPATFALTQSGTVCQFDERRALTRCIDARTDSARPTCLCLLGEFLFVGAFDGQVAAYSAATLQLVSQLPKPHNVLDDDTGGSSKCVKYPDVVALAADTRGTLLASVYNDHSLYVWNVAADVEDKENDCVSISASVQLVSRAHSKCVWHVDIYPALAETQANTSLFVTCGNDCTLRFWRVADESTELVRTVALDADCGALLDANIAAYTNQFDQQTAASSDVPVSYFGPAASGSPRVAGQQAGRAAAGRNAQAVALQPCAPVAASKSGDLSAAKTGLKVARFRPDGRELAVGDRVGNVRVLRITVHNTLASVLVDSVQMLAAHDNEVTALEYLVTADCCLLASASRDRMIHLFDAARGYEHLQTLDEHSSVVNAVRFIVVPQPDAPDTSANVSGSAISAANVRCVSCSADHSLLFRSMLMDEAGRCRFVLAQNTALKTALYDIEAERQQLTVVGQDRFVRSFCADTCKPTRQFRIAVNEHPSVLGFGSTSANVNVNPGASSLTAFPIRIAAAPSGALTALALTNKDVQLYDAAASSLLSAANGHGELVLGLRFSHDSRRLITVAGDGCVFVWRVTTPAERRALAGLRSATSSPRRPVSDSVGSSPRSPLSTAFGLSPNRPIDSSILRMAASPAIGSAKKAARDSVDVDEVPCRDVSASILAPSELEGSQNACNANGSGLLNGSGNLRARVTGAWAQRAVGEPLIIKSRLDQSGTVTLTVDQLLAFDNDSSRRRISMDSSVCTVDLANHSMNSSTASVLPSCAEEPTPPSLLPPTAEHCGVVSALIDTVIREEREASDAVDGYRTAPVSEAGHRGELHAHLSLSLRHTTTDQTKSPDVGDAAVKTSSGAAEHDDKMTASTPISDILTLPESDDHNLFGTPRRLEGTAQNASSIREEQLDEASVRSQIENWLNDVDAAGVTQPRPAISITLPPAESERPDEAAQTTSTGNVPFETPKRQDASDVESSTKHSDQLLNAVSDTNGTSSFLTPPPAVEYRTSVGTRETCTQRFLQMTRSRNNRHLRFSLQNDVASASPPSEPKGLANESDPLDYNRNHTVPDEETDECDCDDLFTIVTGLGHPRAHRSPASPSRSAKANYANRLATSKSMIQTSMRFPSFIQFANRLTRSKSECSDRRVRSVSDAESSALSSASSFSTERKSRNTAFRIVGSPMRNSSRNAAPLQKSTTSTSPTITPIVNGNSPLRRFASAPRNSYTRQRQLGLTSPPKLGAKLPVGSTHHVMGVPPPNMIACPLRDQLGYVHALQLNVEHGLSEVLTHELFKATLQSGTIAAALQLLGLTEQHAAASAQHCKLLRAELEQRLPKPPQVDAAQQDLDTVQPAVSTASTAAEHEPQPISATGETNVLCSPPNGSV